MRAELAERAPVPHVGAAGTVHVAWCPATRWPSPSGPCTCAELAGTVGRIAARGRDAQSVRAATSGSLDGRGITPGPDAQSVHASTSANAPRIAPSGPQTAQPAPTDPEAHPVHAPTVWRLSARAARVLADVLARPAAYGRRVPVDGAPTAGWWAPADVHAAPSPHYAPGEPAGPWSPLDRSALPALAEQARELAHVDVVLDADRPELLPGARIAGEELAPRPETPAERAERRLADLAAVVARLPDWDRPADGSRPAAPSEPTDRRPDPEPAPTDRRPDGCLTADPDGRPCLMCAPLPDVLPQEAPTMPGPDTTADEAPVIRYETADGATWTAPAGTPGPPPPQDTLPAPWKREETPEELAAERARLADLTAQVDTLRADRDRLAAEQAREAPRRDHDDDESTCRACHPELAQDDPEEAAQEAPADVPPVRVTVTGRGALAATFRPPSPEQIARDAATRAAQDAPDQEDDLDASAWARCPHHGPTCPELHGGKCCCADAHTDTTQDAVVLSVEHDAARDADVIRIEMPRAVTAAEPNPWDAIRRALDHASRLAPPPEESPEEAPNEGPGWDGPGMAPSTFPLPVTVDERMPRDAVLAGPRGIDDPDRGVRIGAWPTAPLHELPDEPDPWGPDLAPIPDGWRVHWRQMAPYAAPPGTPLPDPDVRAPMPAPWRRTTRAAVMTWTQREPYPGPATEDDERTPAQRAQDDAVDAAEPAEEHDVDVVDDARDEQDRPELHAAGIPVLTSRLVPPGTVLIGALHHGSRVTEECPQNDADDCPDPVGVCEACDAPQDVHDPESDTYPGGRHAACSAIGCAENCHREPAPVDVHVTDGPDAPLSDLTLTGKLVTGKQAARIRIGSGRLFFAAHPGPVDVDPPPPGAEGNPWRDVGELIDVATFGAELTPTPEWSEPAPVRWPDQRTVTVRFDVRPSERRVLRLLWGGQLPDERAAEAVRAKSREALRAMRRGAARARRVLALPVPPRHW